MVFTITLRTTTLKALLNGTVVIVQMQSNTAVHQEK